MEYRPAAMSSNRIAVAFANVAHFYAHVLMLLYPTVVLALEGAFGLSYGELLTLALPGFVLFGVAALPAGWLGDRWSAHGMMALFFLGSGAAAILTGLAASALELAAGLALIGLFASIYHPVGTAVVVGNAVNRGRALGVNGVFGSAGVALAPLIASGLLGAMGWRSAFLLPGALSMLTGLGFLYAARRGVGRRRIARPPDPAVSRADSIRGLGIVAVTTLAVGLIAQALMVGLPKLFDVSVALFASAGPVGTGGLVTAALLFGMAGQYVGGRLADAWPLERVYVGMMAMAAPVAVLAAGLRELPLVAACAAVMMLTSAAVPSENSLVARYCPRDWRATAYGVKFVLALGVSSLAVPMVGAIYDRFGGFYWLFVAIALLAALVAACGLFLPPARRAVIPVAAPAE